MVKENMVDDILRVDAQANRDRILKVARDALASDPDSSLNSIAKAAGVGAGTLYRHFPTREALVLGVYHHELDAMVTLAGKLLAKHKPMKAFRLWCDQLAQFGKMKYGVADIVHAATSDQSRQEVYTSILDAVRQLMDACKKSGDINPRSKPEDFLMLLGLLWRIPPTPEGEAQVTRLLELAFRGLSL